MLKDIDLIYSEKETYRLRGLAHITGDVVLDKPLIAEYPLIIKGSLSAPKILAVSLDVSGNVETKETIKVKGFCRGKNIQVSNGGIITGGGLAGDEIITTHGIKSRNLKCEQVVSTGPVVGKEFIAAKYVRCAYLFCSSFNVSVRELITTALPFSMHYYCRHEPFQKYVSLILNHLEEYGFMSKKELLKLLDPITVLEICSWQGWHPLIRYQLMMYFGTIKKVSLSSQKDFLDIVTLTRY